MLAVLFCVAASFLSLVALFNYLHLNPGGFFPPAIVLILAWVMALYELAMRELIARRIRQQGVISKSVWYANALVETGLVSTVIFAVGGVFDHPIYALSIPAVLAYFIFIILSTLHLDFRLSLFTGAVASVEYLTIALNTLVHHSSINTLFTAPFMYVAKALLILFGGIGAALVAAELQRRLRNSVIAIAVQNQEQQANKLKSQFLARMSHEIRTPLNAILGYAQLLAADKTVQPEHQAAIRTIGVSGRHLLAVINDVLDLSKIEAGREEIHESVFSPRGIFDELAVIFSHSSAEKGLSFTTRCDLADGLVRGDETKLRQILTNLLGNAVKFTEAGGIVFSAQALADGTHRFEVADTGPGISMDDQAVIFDPFRQAASGHERSGSGLGLAIASRHADLMGGALSVMSEPGKGSSFVLTLTLFACDSRTPGTQGDADGDLRLSMETPVCAMVVDDGAQNRKVLDAALRLMGVEVHVAVDGTEALAMMKGMAVDIVFLDIQMAGLSGFDVRRKMRPGIKAVAVSASALAHERAGYLAAGFDGVLDKPVLFGDVRSCLTQLLGARFDEERNVSAPREAEPPADGLRLPADLHKALLAAAEGHNVTVLKTQLPILAVRGSGEAVLAEELQAFATRYDMKAIKDRLKDVAHD
tara:strand:+ start:1010 stop:2950 length:1941 start_codon:yes stop_codon:yes gene_type:complete